MAAAWLEHHRTRDDAHFWAWEEVDDRVGSADGLEDGWDVTMRLIAEATEDDLQYVGAGPLEHYIRHHGTAAASRIEAQASEDPKFRACLGTIWLEYGDLPVETVDRIIRASGDRIKLLRSKPTDA